MKTIWDGRDSSEQSVASGVYYYTLVLDGVLGEARRSIVPK